MRTRVIACALAAASSADAQLSQEPFIRYDFGIRVLNNTVATNGIGGDLATLGVGTEGVLTFDVNPDPTLFPSGSSVFQVYQTLGVGIDIGSITSAGRPSSYPSQNELSGSFIVENDAPISGNTTYSDSIAALVAFENPELALSLFSIVERLPIGGGQLPGMITSIDAPLAIDVSNLTSVVHFTIASPREPDSRVFFEVFDATATLIPTPASGAVLALGALASVRRRR